MSKLLNSAFNLAAKIAARKGASTPINTIERVKVFPKEPIMISMSNFGEDNPVLDETSSHGYEFIITKENLDKTLNYREIKKTDVIHDPVLGTLTVDFVRPMFALGQLVGWRIRTR